MTDYLTEEEQVELLKYWIKQYGMVIIAGMALALAAVTGWRYWQQRQYRILTHASSVYDAMLSMREQNDAKATTTQAKKILRHYPKTVYGEMAAFMIAREAVDQKNYEKAQSELNKIIDTSKTNSFKQIARLRLARIQLAGNQPEAAIKTLQKVDDKNFVGMINEIEGDAYLVMKQPDKAREAYQKALDNLPNAEIVRPILQMKYDNLTTTTS